MLDLTLTPSGRLVLQEIEGAGTAALPESLASSLRTSFDKGLSGFLLHLATMRDSSPLPPVFLFWRRLAERYLTELCHVPETAENLNQPIIPPENCLLELVQSAPPMQGGEYLSATILEPLWNELDQHARREIASYEGGLSAWLRNRSPLWHRVGRVCFHLAENKRNPERPFAFLATYAPKLLAGGRVQYLPLGRALEEYAGAKNKQVLVNLLSPVQRAAAKCPWIKELVDSGGVFHPLAWSPGEAHRFLRDIPALEESGLLVRVPDWWTKRSPRVRVGVSIGDARQPRFDVSSMLDFNVELTLDGERLTEAEWESIRNGADGLAFIKGRWVEVDREKLTSALEQWRRVEKEAGDDGISFLQGMRLLAGVPLDPDLAGLFDGGDTSWSDVHSGVWLDERLADIRNPDALKHALPGATELLATLRPYQETGVKWLWLLSKLGLGACLADDMGLGKTIQVLALVLMKKKDNRAGANAPALLVLPASLLANWKSEIERFAPSLRIKFAHPSAASAEDLKKGADDPRAFVQDTDVVLTTYGMLSRQEWLATPAWDLVVLDEAQAIKNPAARQTRAVKQLKARAKIALTGTPVENRLTDLWSIFDFICPGLLGSVKTFGDFVKRLEGQDTNQYGALRKLVSPYIMRRLKTDKSIISDLPDKIEVQAFCNLTKKQAVLYEQSVDELKQALEEKDGIARRGAVLSFILRFKQICNHPAQWLASGDYAPDDSGKFQRLCEICEEIAGRQEKALIFTQFREMTEPLARYLNGVFGRAGLVLHGGTAVSKRKNLVDEFQRDDGPPFLVLSLKAGGTGLNLTAAAHVIHFDRWWNPAVENQATDRAFRIGQRKNVMVHKFVCRGTIEEKIDALIQDKTQLAGEILDGGVPATITEMSNEELLNMVKLDVNTLKED